MGQMEIFAGEAAGAFDAAVLGVLRDITKGCVPRHQGVMTSEIAERLPHGHRVQVSHVHDSLVRCQERREVRYSSRLGGLWWPKDRWEREMDDGARAENKIRENAGR